VRWGGWGGVVSQTHCVVRGCIAVSQLLVTRTAPLILHEISVVASARSMATKIQKIGQQSAIYLYLLHKCQSSTLRPLTLDPRVTIEAQWKPYTHNDTPNGANNSDAFSKQHKTVTGQPPRSKPPP